VVQLIKHLPDPLTISDFQFECLMIVLSAALLLPAVFTLYLLHLTFKIESVRTETQEL
jgi:hypothetical protein